MRCKYLVFLIVFLLGNFAFADIPIKSFTLDNGVKVVAIKNKKIPFVVVQNYIKAGTAYEPIDKPGISFALEHILFWTRPLKGNKSFIETIDSLGGKTSVITSFDYILVNYKVSSDKFNEALALNVEALRLKDLDKIKLNKIGEVLSQKKQFLFANPEAKLTSQLLRSYYHNYPYGKEQIGDDSLFNKLSGKDYESYYQQNFGGSNLSIAIVGDFDDSQIEKLVKSNFSSLPKSLKVNGDLDGRENIKPLTKSIQITDSQKEVNFYKRLYFAESFNNDSNKVYGMMVLAELIGGGRFGQLTKDLVEDKPYFTSIISRYDPISSGLTTISIEGDLASTQNNKAIEDYFADIANSLSNKIDDTKLNAAKKMVMTKRWLSLDSFENMAYRYGSMLSTNGDFKFYQQFDQEIEKVNLDQIKSLIKEVFSQDSISGIIASR